MTGSAVIRLSEQELTQCTALFEEHLRHNRRVSERELINLLEQQFPTGWSSSPLLSLFQKHFIVRHCLYRFQEQAMATGGSLDIGPVEIHLLPETPASRRSPATDNTAALREFYGNWQNLDQATEDNVADLLADFWRRFEAWNRSDSDLSALGLDDGADWQAVQQQYRRLVAEHHPDKGGDSKRFHRIREAYERLRRSMNL